MPSDLSKRSQETADYIKSRISKETNFQQPRAAVICGSGLGGLADTFETTVTIPYGDIPNFPESTVVGHASKLVYGLVGDNKVPAIAMVGRFHFYEGHAITTTTFPVRVFKKLGIEVMIATNAAGGLNEHYRVGDLVVLNDHLNLPGLVGQNPLFGPNVCHIFR
jgi:purine-nucleoside phosphorylase